MAAASQPRPSPAPTVSVVVANYNGAAHIDACLRTLLDQTLREIEVIVVDDASTDDSRERVRAAAAADPRVVLLSNQGRKGPAGARNTALTAARGEWIAIVDSDDLVYARRLEDLVASAGADGADMVADDLLIFDDGAWTSRRFLHGPRLEAPSWITAEDYLDANHLFGRGPILGFLKPLVRRAALDGIRYDESLRIAEDYDLVLRLLLRGARFRLYPQPTYLYRKHASSISHVLQLADIETMIASHRTQAAEAPAGLAAAFARRGRSLERAADFTRLVEALKRRRLAEAVRIGLHDPGAALLLRLPVLKRLAPAPREPERPRGPSACLICRLRVAEGTDARSARLRAVAEAVRELGVEVRLLQPSSAAEEAAWTGDDLVHVAERAPLSDAVLFEDASAAALASPYLLRDEPVRLILTDDRLQAPDAVRAAVAEALGAERAATRA